MEEGSKAALRTRCVSARSRLSDVDRASAAAALVEAVTAALAVLPPGPTAAYACIKESVAYAATSSLVDALAKEDELQTRAGGTADHVGAVRSFLAKQVPVFSGR